MVLAFHKVWPAFTYGATNYPPKRLLHLLDKLQALDYALAESARGHSAFIELTFDDGYDHLRDILPKLIKRYRCRPRVFMPTSFIGGTNSWDYSHRFQRLAHLSADGVRELVAAGVAFGGHSHSHVDLTGLGDEELQAELTGSRGRLENVLGAEVDSLSYPFGRVNHRVVDAARVAGYRRGYTMKFPTDTDSELAAGRMAVYGFDTPLSVLRKLRPGTFQGVERAKAWAVNGLSGGTILLNRLRGSRK